MTVRAHLLPSAIICLSLSLFCFEALRARVFHNVDPTASEPLQKPTIAQQKCSTRLKNGFPIPDPACTPGAINPTVTINIICDASWSAAKQLSESQRAEAYNWYDIAPPNEGATDALCHLNHLIPLTLGGTDTLDNIWPMCGPPGALPSQTYREQKNDVDEYLSKEVN